MLAKMISLCACTGLFVLLGACSSGGSSSSSDSEGVTGSDASLKLPSQLEVVTSDDDTGSRFTPLSRSFGNRFDDPGTDYLTDEQNFHIWNEALEPIELVNSILCFAEQFRANDFVNEGPYVVLANDQRCFDEGGNNDTSGSSGQSSGASNAVSYMEVVVNSVRQTPTSPLVISVWMPEMGEEDGGEQAIKFKAVISEGATDTNPFGSFTFNFDFFDNFTDNNQNGGGEVRTVDIAGSIGFTLFESSTRDSETFTQNASVVMSSDKTTGRAVTSVDRGAFGGDAFALAYNASNVLVQTDNSIAGLPYNVGDNSGTCLSRTSFNEAVWRYDLYDVDSGDRVEINSGFPFQYDSNSDSQVDAYGFIGYYGMWTEEEGALSNGDTIVADNNGTDVNYTVVSAPGRLIKNTVESLSLTNARGITFYLWDDDLFSNNYNQWIVNYLTVADDGVGADGFYKVGGQSWSENGPTVDNLSPSLITLSSNEILNMYSNQLGGNIQYVQGDDEITFFEQSYVNGSETGSGQLLNSGSVTLVCYERCPIGTLSASDLQNFDGANSPYSTNANTLADAISYTFSTTGSNALTLVRSSNSEPVRYASGLTVQQLETANSPFSWGVNTGAMVTSTVAATLTNPWDIYNADLVTEFYTWETGLNQWNQLQVVRDSDSNIVTFQKPLEFAYQHSDANDRSNDAGDYDGQTYFVSYGGNGDFWGIPFENTGGDRWYPLFNIDDGVAMDGGNYVIKAREIEQSMAAAPGQCGALTLADPAAVVPTSTVGSADIGDMPTVTSEPAVIDGVIQ